MNAPLLPEVFVGELTSPEPQLPLAAEGVQRTIWESRFGPILIEVKEGVAFVNGEAVQPFAQALDPGER